MSHYRFALVALLVAAGLFILLVPSEPAQSQETRSVYVTNFPATVTVAGEVKIDGPVRVSESVAFREVVVPPVKRSQTTRLVDAGVLTTDGFPSVVLSLHGEVKGSITTSGNVGVILLPDEKTIAEAFNEEGQLHFALEATAGKVSSATPYFASNQPRYMVGFHAYRVLLYNETDRTVTANLFAYLTN